MPTLTAVTLPCGTFVLRRAQAHDVAGIVELLASDQLGANRDGIAAPDDFAAYAQAFAAIDADNTQLLLVAVDDRNDLAGTAQLSFIRGLARKGTLRAQIEGVRIRSDLRSAGLGSVVIDWTVAEARRRGCSLVQLTTDKSRIDAHRFYERLGFVPSHVGMKLHLTE